MTKLALFLLAFPACSTFAAADYSSLISSSSNFSKNDVTPNTLLAAGDTTLGTASDPNENHIGWSTTPDRQLLVVWTADGPRFSGLNAPLDLGGATSYNTLSIDNVVKLTASTLKMGVGALIGGTGADAALVDTNKLANNNVLNLSGAGYQKLSPYTVSTTLHLTTSASSYVGRYGNNNAVNITGGAKLSTVYNFTIGSSDENNPTYGCNNSVSVSGSVKIDVLGNSTNSISSTLELGAGLFVGQSSSGNTLTVADNAKLTVNVATHIGYFGDNNKLSVSSSDVSVGGDIVAGRYPGSDGNEITFDDVDLNVSTSGHSISIGRYSVGNKLTVSDSSLHISDLDIGFGDYSAVKNNSDDGTEGYVATEGCSNTATITSTQLHTQSDGCSVFIGYYGSDNSLTIKDSSIYSAWTDAGSPVDGKVQFDEIAKIASIVVGNGHYSGTTDNYASFGKNNKLTLDNVVVKATDMMVGTYSSNNTATLENGTQVGISNDLLVGNGDDHDVKQGSGNTILLSGAGTALTVGGNTSLGNLGSNNLISISDGAKLTLAAINKFGYGMISDAETDNTAFGCGNVLSVTGKGSSLQIGDTTIDFYIGDYGSNNELVVSDGATCIIKANDVILGNSGTELGNVLNSHKVYSRGNKITVSGGATLDASQTDDIYVGKSGIENSITVTGEGSYFVADDIAIGVGNASSITFGSYNSIEVSDGAVLVGDAISIGQTPSSGYSGVHNSLTVDGGVIVSTKYIRPNVFTSDDNVLRIKNGIVALIGKSCDNIDWVDYIVNGYNISYDNPSNSWLDGVSLVDKGGIQIWDATIGAYRKAIKSDLSIKYYSNEAEAKAATGYSGLAGYTVVTQTNDLNRLAWAGDVYDGGNGYYCSSWYGWFYNDASYGDYIMSCNDNAWQYVDPSSTPENTYLYDYNLNSWLYTNTTEITTRGVYNYSKSAWMHFGE